MSKRTTKMFIVVLLALPFVIASLVSFSAQAQPQFPSTPVQPSELAGNLKEIEKQVEEKRKELAVPGVALAIVKDDKVIFQEGFVDGEMVPFRFVNQNGSLGRVVSTLQEVKFNVAIPSTAFRPSSK